METRKVSQYRKKTLKHRLPFLKHYNSISGFGYNNVDLTEYKTTYGEVDNDSLPVLNELFNKYAPITKIALPFRNFYDLGSGVGKLTIAMAYMNPTLKTTGIEIVPDRVKKAHTAFEKIRDISVKNRVELLCISMLNDSVNYANACWIFISNLCLTDDTNNKIFEKLAKEVKIGCIIISSSKTQHTSFKELNHISIPMSWDAKSKVYVYSRV